MGFNGSREIVPLLLKWAQYRFPEGGRILEAIGIH